MLSRSTITQANDNPDFEIYFPAVIPLIPLYLAYLANRDVYPCAVNTYVRTPICRTPIDTFPPLRSSLSSTSPGLVPPRLGIWLSMSVERYTTDVTASSASYQPDGAFGHNNAQFLSPPSPYAWIKGRSNFVSLQKRTALLPSLRIQTAISDRRGLIISTSRACL